jgi:hypothetical protein
MYVNPWKFEVGDLVKCRLLTLSLPLAISTAIRNAGCAMIVDRRRSEVYVEGRPIRIIEVDEYRVSIDDAYHWAPEESLILSQKTNSGD